MILTAHYPPGVPKILDFVNGVQNAIKPTKAEFVYDLYQQYQPSDLIQHPAVIMLPYSVMSYRLTELYGMSIPLFIPSPRFYLNYIEKGRRGLGWDRTITSPPYCTIKFDEKFRPAFNIHPYSPNVEMVDDPESEMYWMQFADFYDWPHIQHFDTYDHLAELLSKVDLNAIHQKMKQEVALKKLRVSKSWCDISSKIVS